jgi:hypothetical protein
MECRLYNVNDRLAVLDLTELIEKWIEEGTLVDMASCFLPYRDGSNSDVPDEEGVFQMDIDALEECTGVAGFMDGLTYDSGCAFEIGCGYAWGYPVHLITTDIFKWFAGSTDSSDIYSVSKLMQHIAKIVHFSQFDISIPGYRERNEELRERSIAAFKKNLIEEYGTVSDLPVKMEALPVVYDYYLDAGFGYTESGKALLAQITEAIKNAGKTYVLGDTYGDVAADIDHLRESGQAVFFSDVCEPNVDSGILQGIAYGIGRKPIVYSSTAERYFMAGKYSSWINTMIYYSADKVVFTMDELIAIISR